MRSNTASSRMKNYIEKILPFTCIKSYFMMRWMLVPKNMAMSICI